MEELIMLFLAAALGGLGYHIHLKNKAKEGQKDLEIKTERIHTKIEGLEQQQKEVAKETQSVVKQLETEKKKEVTGEDLAKFFNDFLNRK
jgi:subtilase family serine protease